MNAPDAVPGVFGKIPARADFVRRRLPATFLGPWDGWLGQAIARSRADLGPAWLDAYLTSPLWCFALGPGVCGPSPVAGVLVPSVDAVNRHFPLTLGSVLADDCRPFAVATAAPWFAALEELALAALAERLEPDALANRLEAIGPPTVPPLQCASIAPDGAGTLLRSWPLAADAEDRGPEEIYPGLLDDLAHERFGAVSLWWTQGSDAIEPIMRLYRGLPHEDEFATFLTNLRPEPAAAADAAAAPDAKSIALECDP
ncbi:MAG: type VI secretion system-associated protein TagF [Defluviicoccus sp.]|nr:type VI secretion system-associated protein TagF [Defluviicoccus sp.]